MFEFIKSKRGALLTVGVLFHLIYLWSIFDIYFVSPLVHGMKQHAATNNAPAKRLFLIVGDGQRADKTLGKVVHPSTGKEEYLAPYLRSVVLNHGTYGLSHTRMPTESRPGHVAMIAGFYEDVSAVTKGWKENPVDFDSVFNQSTHTYSFGSPDILPMFAQGANDGTVDTWMYGHEFEDFTQSSIELDRFVFNHLYSLFENSTSDSVLDEQIRQDGNVFFLHLLGTDTCGHGYRPYSAEYYDNIKYTDSEIEKLVARVNEFFNDEETAFIFTADHGMSDLGSHGDGHPNNTRTPLICWGKGCNLPKKIPKSENLFLLDEFEREDMSNWDLDEIMRHDVKQADIAPLMSYLVGLNYPMNSVGELPLEFIAAKESDKIRGLYLNSLSLLEQYYVKLDEVKASQFEFKDFHKFSEKPISEYQKEIEEMIELMDNDESLEPETIKLIETFNSVILEGLDYLQKYNWLMLRTIVSLGFFGWIVYSFVIFLQLFIVPKKSEIANNYFNHAFFALLSSVMTYILYYQKSPFNYYLYLLFPLFFWNRIVELRKDLFVGFSEFFRDLSYFQIFSIFISIIAFFEAIAIGFTKREIFSFMFILLAFYPILLPKSKEKLRVSIFWFFTCILLSYFPIQSPVKTESLNLILSSGLILLMISIYLYVTLKQHMTSATQSIILFQISLVILSLYSTTKAVVSLQNRTGLPIDAQTIGWSVLAISLTIPFILHAKFPHSNYKVRFFIIFLAFSPTFIILTISFETYFYILFALMIYQWIELESLVQRSTINKNIKLNPWMQLLRVSIIGFFNLQIAFFGTGNISSISTFSLDSVYRLLPIFDPFPMGALLMLKLIIPYILLSAGLGLLNLKLGLKPYSVTSLVICVCDLLSVNFFFLVKTEGSWLDIGVSISNYCLAIFGALFIGIVEVASGILLDGVVVENEKKKFKQLDSLKMDDQEYKKIEKMITEEGLDGSIGSRVRRRNLKI